MPGVWEHPLRLAGCVLYGAYGIRLTCFLLRRNNDSSFAARLQATKDKTVNMGVLQRFAVVAGVSFSQALYVLPLRLATQFPLPRSGSNREALCWLGISVAAVGLVIESIADEQKLASKRVAPDQPVMDGLYAWCRHPNYGGEIMFHLGICALAVNGDAVQVICAVLAPLGMVNVMFVAAKRLDAVGQEKYASNREYQTWFRRTSALFPEPEFSKEAYAKAKSREWGRQNSKRWTQYQKAD